MNSHPNQILPELQALLDDQSDPSSAAFRQTMDAYLQSATNRIRQNKIQLNNIFINDYESLQYTEEKLKTLHKKVTFFHSILDSTNQDQEEKNLMALCIQLEGFLESKITEDVNDTVYSAYLIELSESQNQYKQQQQYNNKIYLQEFCTNYMEHLKNEYSSLTGGGELNSDLDKENSVKISKPQSSPSFFMPPHPAAASITYSSYVTDPSRVNEVVEKYNIVSSWHKALDPTILDGFEAFKKVYTEPNRKTLAARRDHWTLSFLNEINEKLIKWGIIKVKGKKLDNEIQAIIPTLLPKLR